MWIEREVKISEIKALLDLGCAVEIDSPDGFVPIMNFIDKGVWDAFEVVVGGKTLVVNCDHLFETPIGWMSASDMLMRSASGCLVHVLTDDAEWVRITSIRQTGDKVPIVDIHVAHDNHRYYANGISSHNTGVGKSLFMCHNAAALLKAGKNVLYITLEMAEERIAERIDCNLMDISIDHLSHVKRGEFMDRVDNIKRKSHGKLVIKEYPTSSAHVGHFKNLLDELKIKKNFKPDVVFVDYINICASQRYKGAANTNSYFTVKAIAEELRGMAMEYDIAVVTATQTTRSGFTNTDVEMGDTSESFGLPMTLDFMVAIIRTEELDATGQLMVKQLKSRFGDINYYKKFVIGVDIKKFRLYDVDQPTKDLSGVGSTDDDKPAFDNTRFASATKSRDFGLLDFDAD